MRPSPASLSHASAPGKHPAAPSFMRRAAARLHANLKSKLFVARPADWPAGLLTQEQRQHLDEAWQQRWDEEQRRWDEEQRRWDEEQRRWDEEQRRWDEEQRRWDEEQQRRDEVQQRWRAQVAEQEQARERRSIQDRALDHELQQSQQLLAQQVDRICALITELSRTVAEPFWIGELCLSAAESIRTAAQNNGKHDSGVIPRNFSIPGWAVAWLRDSGDSVDLEERDLTLIFNFVPFNHEYGNHRECLIGHEAVETQAATVRYLADTPEGDSLARIFVFVHGCSADTV